MKVVFNKGKIIEKDTDSVESIIDELRSKLDYLHSLKVNHLIEFFDELANVWLQNKDLEKKTGISLKHLADFIKKNNTQGMLELALRGDYLILDKFVDLKQKKYIYHCQPRGLAVHWLSGNVPFLGLYALVQTILTKNVSLVKASSKSYKELLFLLESFSSVKTKHIDGSRLLETLCVILVDNNDKKTHEQLSNAADIRIAWGGHEAISSILSLKKNFYCEDIVYGPKYSFGVIDKESLNNYKKIAQRIAFDICTFDQYACSSPHTIFIEESESVTLEYFAEELAKHMDTVTRKLLPKGEEDTKKKSEIMAARAKYSILGKVFSSDNLDWTIVVSRDKDLADPVFSRVVQIRPINKISSLGKYVDKKKQTLGCALSSNNREEIIDTITREGIDRCPQFGDMTLYESPWDGFFAIDRMVRWVSLYKNEK